MSELEEQPTCLRVTKGTRNRIAKLGGKDQTFDQILMGMLDKRNKSSGESLRDE